MPPKVTYTNKHTTISTNIKKKLGTCSEVYLTSSYFNTLEYDNKYHEIASAAPITLKYKV